MKQKPILIATLLIACTTVMSCVNKITVKADELGPKENIQGYGQTILKNYDIDGKNIIDKNTKMVKQAITDKVQGQLTSLGLTCTNIKEAKLVNDNFYNTQTYILDLGDKTIELNTNFELEQVSSNKEVKPLAIETRTFSTTEKINNFVQTDPVIKKIKKSLNIENDYKLVQNESFDENIWVFTTV